jgi:hypothetical protein
VKLDVHERGVVGIAGVVKLFRKLLASVQTGIDIQRLHQINDRCTPFKFFLLAATALSKIGATPTLAAGEAEDDDPGVEFTVGAEPPAVGVAPGAAPALVPKIAPMIFPNMLILTFYCS